MENKIKVIKPLFHREISINSSFAYHDFLKKRTQTFLSLTLKCKNAVSPREANITDPKNTTLVKLFKRMKLTKRVDLSQLHILKPAPSLPAFLYIIKRMRHVKNLSIFDYIGRETNFKGLFTTCPKYMKQLQSLDSQVRISSSEGFLAPQAEVPKKLLFPNDFLKFLPRFKEITARFPFYLYLPQMNRMLRFQKCPPSTRKISLHHPNCRPTALNIPIGDLKALRDLEIVLMSESSFELARSAYSLIAKAPVQLHTLSVNFNKEFYIENSIQASIKRLVNLKKVKLQLSSVRFADSLEILKNLKECPLETLNLDIAFRMDQDILHVKDLITRKKNTLKKLNLKLRKNKGNFESTFCLTDIIKAIDNLPILENLCFLLRFSRPELASVVSFQNLFTKSIPLKKFQLISSHLNFSKDESFNLLKSLGGVASNLEKLRIDVGEFKPTESKTLCEFIRSLVKIQVLKLDNLYVSQQDFWEIVEAVLSLKGLTDLTLGHFFEISLKILVSGVGKILEKYGLRNFGCRILSSPAQEYSRLDLINIKRKNPYIQKYPSTLVSPVGIEEEIW